MKIEILVNHVTLVSHSVLEGLIHVWVEDTERDAYSIVTWRSSYYTM